MNWQEIGIKYPKSYKKYYRYLKKRYKLPVIPFLQEPLQFQSLWGWILEFFDSKGIHINESYSFFNDIVLFTYWINGEPADKFKSRQEAQEEATIKAFEILEQK